MYSLSSAFPSTIFLVSSVSFRNHRFPLPVPLLHTECLSRNPYVQCFIFMLSFSFFPSVIYFLLFKVPYSYRLLSHQYRFFFPVWCFPTVSTPLPTSVPWEKLKEWADQSVCTAYKFIGKLGWTTISFSKCISNFRSSDISIRVCYERLFVHSYTQNSMWCFGRKRFGHTQQLCASNPSDHREAPSPANLVAWSANMTITPVAEAAWMKWLFRISSQGRLFLIGYTETIHWN
jgi:hypothetical protein